MNQCATKLFFKVILPLFLVTQAVFAGDDKLSGMLKEGKFSKAIEHIEKTYPAKERTVDIWLNYAEALEKSGADKQKVVAALTEAQKTQPSDPRVFAMTGEYLVRQKNYQEALKPLQKWYLLERSVKAAESMANCAMFLKDYELARDAAESALRIDSTAVEARKMLSFIYITEKDWASAAEQLEVVVAKNKDDLNYWKKLAACYEELKNRDKLIVASIRIAQLDGKDVKYRTILSSYYLEKKDEKSALPYLKELAVLTPDNAKLFRNLYQISLTNNQKKDAVLYLRNFLVLDSTDAASFKIMGDLLSEQKSADEALSAYRKALKLNPALTGMYRPYLTLLMEKKLDDELVAVIQKAAAAGEVDAPVFAYAGNILKNKNQCAGAIPFFQSALKIDVKNLSLLSSLAQCQAATGKTADALLNYQQVVMLDPEVTEEYRLLGDLLFAQKKTSEGIESYKKYLAKKPGNEEIAAVVGTYYYDKKQCGEALSYFEKVTSQKLLTFALTAKIAGCYYELENYTKAIDYYKRARLKNPPKTDLAGLLKPLAVSLEKTGALAEAASTYEAYVKLPGIVDADASYKQAFLRESTDRAAAITLYQANCTAFPKDQRNFTRLGVLLLTDKDMLTKALTALEKANTLAPDDTLMLVALCNGYNAAGNSSKELGAAQKLATLLPAHTMANSRAGTILYKNKQFSQAVPYLEKMVASQPKDIDALQMLADAYVQVKDFSKAMQQYEDVKQLRPDDVKVRIALIAAAEAAGSKDKVAAYRKELSDLDAKTVAKDSAVVDARLRLADYYFDKQQFDAAMPVYKELSVLVPKNREVVARLVEITAKKGNNTELLSWLKKYVTLDPANAKAHAQLGDLYFSQKNSDGALVEYRQAVKLDPAITGIYKNYGTLVIEKNLDDEAIPVLKGAIKNSEAEPAMYISLGRLYQKRKDYVSAIAMFKKASSDDPKNLEVLSLLGECQAANSEIANAVLTFQQVVMLNPEVSKEYKALGSLLMRQKKNDEAIKSYLEYLVKTADDTIAGTVGLYMYEKKNYKDAVKYLEMVKQPGLKTTEHLLALGDAWYQLKDCAKVCAAYGQLFTKGASESTRKIILRPLGECYEKVNEPEKAAAAYEAYTALPGVADADASYLRVFLKEKSDPKNTEALYLANIKAYPKDSRNYLRLGMFYAESKTTLTKATTYLELAVKLNSKDVAALEKLAKIWNELKNDAKELDAYAKLLALEPQRADANRRAGELYIKSKQYQKAIECLEIVAVAAPNEDTAVRLLLAEGYIAMGRKDRGADLLGKVYAVQKTNPELMARLYLLYKELGKNTEAEATIKSLIAVKSDNRYRAWYANDLIEMKRFDEARAIADAIVKSEPENLDGLMLQGKILACQNRYDDAIEQFKMVSYVKDDFAPANYERAEVYRLMKEYDRAESYYKKVLDTDPKFALAELGLARVYKAKNRMADYTTHLNKAKALEPANSKIMAELSGGAEESDAAAKPKTVEPAKIEEKSSDTTKVDKKDGAKKDAEKKK